MTVVRGGLDAQHAAAQRFYRIVLASPQAAGD
jgi:hypothetical protein